MKKPPLDIFLGDTLDQGMHPDNSAQYKNTQKHLVDAFLQDQFPEKTQHIVNDSIVVSPEEKEQIVDCFDHFAERYDLHVGKQSTMELSDKLWEFWERKLYLALPFYQFSKALILRIELLMENGRWNEVAPLLNMSIPYDEKMAQIDSHFIYDLVRLKTRYLMHKREYAKSITLINGFLASWYEMPNDDLLENLLITQANALYELHNYPQALKAIDMIFSSLWDDVLDNKNLLTQIFLLKWKIFYELKKYNESIDVLHTVLEYDPKNQEAIDYLFHKLPSPNIDILKKYN